MLMENFNSIKNKEKKQLHPDKLLVEIIFQEFGITIRVLGNIFDKDG